MTANLSRDYFVMRIKQYRIYANRSQELAFRFQEREILVLDHFFSYFNVGLTRYPFLILAMTFIK